MARKLELPPEHDARQANSESAAAPLPTSLDKALNALERTAAARDWFGPLHFDAYLRAKRAEAANTKTLDPPALCARYAEAY